MPSQSRYIILFYVEVIMLRIQSSIGDIMYFQNLYKSYKSSERKRKHDYKYYGAENEIIFYNNKFLVNLTHYFSINYWNAGLLTDITTHPNLYSINLCDFFNPGAISLHLMICSAYPKSTKLTMISYYQTSNVIIKHNCQNGNEPHLARSILKYISFSGRV